MAESGLHTRLRNAIEERLKLAERASTYLHATERWRYEGSHGGGPRLIVGPSGDDFWQREVNEAVWTCDDEQDGCPDEARGWSAEGCHLAANDPAFIIRAARADLDRLERHSPIPTPRYQSEPVLVCDHCSDLCHSTSGLLCGDPDAPWPCVEIRELAEVYGIEVSP